MLLRRFYSLLERLVPRMATGAAWVDLLTFHGLWLNDRPGLGIKRGRVRNHVLLGVWTLLVFLLIPITLYHDWGSPHLMAETTGWMFVFGNVLAYWFTLMFEGGRLQGTVTALEAMKVLGGQHRYQTRETMQEERRLVNLATLYFATASTALILTATGVAAFCVTRGQFVVRLWFSFDRQVIGSYFGLTAIFLMSLWVLGLHVVIVVNTLLMSILGQTAGQLHLLAHNMAAIGHRHPESPTRTNAKLSSLKLLDVHPLSGRLGRGVKGEVYMVADSGCQQAEEWLKQCVIHHQAITSFMSELQSSFGRLLFCQLVCSVFPVVVTIVILLLGGEVDLKTFTFTVLATATSAQQGLICYLAEKVANQSEGVREAVFGCDWTDQSDSFKRSMRIIMSRSNQPLVVKLAGIPLTMHTFHGVLKMTYSYYMSVAAMLDGKLTS